MTTGCSKEFQSEDQNKIRSGSGDKKTSGVDAETALNDIYGRKYRIRLDHQILTDHGVFYPTGLNHNLKFELLLAPASQVDRGSDPSKLKYKLENIQLEYEVIDEFRGKGTKELANAGILIKEAVDAYSSCKGFLYDHIHQEIVAPLKKDVHSKINIKVNSGRRSQSCSVVFVEPYTAGTRDSEKYIFPNITKVKVTIKGSPNKVFSEGLESKDFWEEAKRYFQRSNNKAQAHMTAKNTTQKTCSVCSLICVPWRTTRCTEAEQSW